MKIDQGNVGIEHTETVCKLIGIGIHNFFEIVVIACKQVREAYNCNDMSGVMPKLCEPT